MSALVRRALAETIGTAVLLATVVGSGVKGAALAQGNERVGRDSCKNGPKVS